MDVDKDQNDLGKGRDVRTFQILDRALVAPNGDQPVADDGVESEISHKSHSELDEGNPGSEATYGDNESSSNEEAVKRDGFEGSLQDDFPKLGVTSNASKWGDSPKMQEAKNVLPKNIPNPWDCELDFVLKNADTLMRTHHTDKTEQFYSEWKILLNFKFRILVMTTQTRNSYQMAEEKYFSAFVEAGKMDDWPDNWGFMGVRYHIMAINLADPRNSIYKYDSFHFNYSETDRGWFQFLPFSQVQEGFMTADKSIVFRAGVFPLGSEADRLYRDANYDSRYSTGFVGLRNHGATCYMNALLQTLYHIGKFRKAVYEMDIKEAETLAGKSLAIMKRKSTKKAVKSSSSSYLYGGEASLDALDGLSKTDVSEAESENIEEAYGLHENSRGESTVECDSDEDKMDFSDWNDQDIKDVLKEEEEERKRQPTITLALQNLFYKLYFHDIAVPCKELIRSFGWDIADAFTQQDTHELLKLLLDKVEEQMRGTPGEGCVKSMFEGESETYIECLDIDYKSTRSETFEDIQLDVRGCKNVQESLQKATMAEILEGENMYEAEGHGKQRAKKGIRFKKFPPVMILLLKRVDYDLHKMDTVKVNDRFEFPKEIDFSEFCPGAGVYSLHAVCVHQGDVNNGHYYAFCFCDQAWYKFDDDKVIRVNEYSVIGDNFGGDECDLWNYLAEGERPPQKTKMYNAYILAYIKKELTADLVVPCDPRQVNARLVERCRLEEKLVEKRQSIKRLLARTVKLNIYEPHAFLRNCFAQLPLKDVKETLSRKFDRSTDLTEVVSRLHAELRPLRPTTSNSYFFFHYMNGSEKMFRFNMPLLGSFHKNQSSKASLTLDNIIATLEKGVLDVYDPTIYMLAIEDSRAPPDMNFNHYVEMSGSSTLLVHKYFDTLAPNPDENSLICLDMTLVEKNIRVRSMEEKVRSQIAKCAEDGLVTALPNRSVIEPSKLNTLDAFGNAGAIVFGNSSNAAALHCLVEFSSETQVVNLGKSLCQAKLMSGDILVWSFAPSAEAQQAKSKKEAIVWKVDTSPTEECSPSNSSVAAMEDMSSMEVGENGFLLRLPVGYGGYSPAVCPPLPEYLIHSYDDFLKKQLEAVNVSFRLYDPIGQLRKHQNVSGLLFEDYADTTQPNRAEDGGSAAGTTTEGGTLKQIPRSESINQFEGGASKFYSTHTGEDGGEEGDPFYHHPKGRPVVVRSFDLDLRMVCKQVIKHVAWHMNVDPTHLLIYQEPPLLCGPEVLHQSIDTMYAEDNSRRELETLKGWFEHYHHSSRFPLLIMHLAVIPMCASSWAQNASTRIKMRNHYIVQVFNVRMECVWADADELRSVGPVVEQITVQMLITHIKNRLPKELVKHDVSADLEFRLMNTFCAERLEEYHKNLYLSDLSWFCNSRLSNGFRYPLRMEPAYSRAQKEQIRAGSLKELLVVHQTPAPDRESFGYPFHVLIPAAATLGEIRGIIKEKLKLPDKYWNQFRGWHQLSSQTKSWKASDDKLDWNQANLMLVAEHPMPYSKSRNQAAMRIA